MDAGAVEARNFFTNATRRWFFRSLCAFSFSVLSQRLYLWRRTVLKNIYFILAVVVWFAKGVMQTKCRKIKAAGCIPFLIKAMQLAGMTPCSLSERQDVEQIVLHRVLNALACGTHRQRSFLCAGRE